MMNTNISLENLNQFEQGFDTNPTNALAMNAVVSNGINAVPPTTKQSVGSLMNFP